MIRKVICVLNPQGLHARPASIFVKIANRFQSDIRVTKDDEKLDGKSIMNVLMLAAEKGSEITLEVSGPDEVEAMDELEMFLLDTREPTEKEDRR